MEFVFVVLTECKMNNGVELFRAGLSMHETAMRAMEGRLAWAEAKIIAFEAMESRLALLEATTVRCRVDGQVVSEDSDEDLPVTQDRKQDSYKGKGKNKDKRKEPPAKKSKPTQPAAKSSANSSHAL